MAGDRGNLHAVPNQSNTNGNGNSMRELVKTVAITSAVSSLVGVFAVAGGQALWHLLKRAVSPKPKPVAQPTAQNGPPPGWTTAAQASPNPPAWGAGGGDGGDEVPEFLRHRPHLRNTGPMRRGRRSSAAPVDNEIKEIFENFAKRIDERFSHLEKRVDTIDDELTSEEDDQE